MMLLEEKEIITTHTLPTPATDANDVKCKDQGEETALNYQGQQQLQKTGVKHVTWKENLEEIIEIHSTYSTSDGCDNSNQDGCQNNSEKGLMPNGKSVSTKGLSAAALFDSKSMNRTKWVRNLLYKRFNKKDRTVPDPSINPKIKTIQVSPCEEKLPESDMENAHDIHRKKICINFIDTRSGKSCVTVLNCEKHNLNEDKVLKQIKLRLKIKSKQPVALRLKPDNDKTEIKSLDSCFANKEIQNGSNIYLVPVTH